jgi:hypothetical protein
MAPNPKTIRYIVNEETGCWEWALRRHKNGYGQTEVKGNALYAHVYYWEKSKGKVPYGFVLDHLCRVRHCVNPDHLEVVTQRENCRRGKATKLTKEQILEIRAITGKLQREIAADYGINQVQVSKILARKSWRVI